MSVRTRAMLRPRASFGSLLVGAALASGALGCAHYTAPAFADGPPPGLRGHFTVIGDLQSTMAVEAWRENNDAERRRLVPEIARRNPAFVVMVGDLVSWGSSTDQWREFDENTKGLRSRAIAVLPVLGNHEYFGGAELGLYFAHFPGIGGQHWYERRYGPLALVFVDSNAADLDASTWDKQRTWYESALDRLEKEDGVRGILVFLHHAPLTNSSVVDDDVHVLEAFVPAFVKKTKTLAMVTGHAHGYERFERQGKAFIVTGGGGGPRSDLRQGEKRRHLDDLFRGPALRHFNFVEFNLETKALHVDVVGLPKGETTFCQMETFDLPWTGGPLGAEDAVAPSPERAGKDCYSGM
jgi:hypothetical protein